MPVETVCSMTRELIARMQETGHPFILGSECDILAVPGAMNAILAKTEAFMAAALK
jgi:hypothetical protein